MVKPAKSRISYHTERGYVTFLEKEVKYKNIIALKSEYGYNLTNIYKRLINYFQANSYQVEILLHSLLSEGYEGIYLPQQEIWIIDEKLLGSNAIEQSERINVTSMYDNISLLHRQRELNILEGEIEKLLQYVYKHFSEASAYKEQKETLLSQMVNKQLYDGKRDKLLHYIFSKDLSSPSKGRNIRRFYQRSEDILTYIPAHINMKKDITFINLNGYSSNNILEEIENKALKQNFSTIGYLKPTSTSKPSIVYIPELATVIMNDRFVRSGYNHHTFDFTPCFTSQYYDTTSKKRLYDLETNITIKTTLGNNYLKEVNQRYKELTSIYNESLITEKENHLKDEILQRVNL
jgi:hypothetical protein